MTDAAAAWIAENADRIATSDSYHALDDLRPMATIARDAVVVALGASSRLTHELSTVTGRVLRRLVEEDGFRSLALEGDDLASIELGNYLSTGDGDPVTLLARARSFWRTQEILDAVRWLRDYNGRHPADPVRVVHPTGDHPVQTATLDDPAEIERAVAENVIRWHERTGHKIVYWGGVAHTAVRDQSFTGYLTMGARLRRHFGHRYISVGLTFHHNTVREIGPVPAADFAEATLGSPEIDADAYILDLRSGPASGPVREWLDSPTKFRLIGPRYDPAIYLSGGSLADWFDVVVQVAETTPVHLLTAG